MRPKRRKLGPKSEDATLQLDRKAWCGMIRHNACWGGNIWDPEKQDDLASEKPRGAMLLKRSSPKRTWTYNDAHTHAHTQACTHAHKHTYTHTYAPTAHTSAIRRARSRSASLRTAATSAARTRWRESAGQNEAAAAEAGIFGGGRQGDGAAGVGTAHAYRAGRADQQPAEGPMSA
eukprot:365284-Chlamydomonas_euryale.AAC.3